MALRCSKVCKDESADSECISSCLVKSERVFDLYMKHAKASALTKRTNEYIDLSLFTGMDVEHKHDTSNKFGPIAPYMDVTGLKAGQDAFRRNLADIRDQAI